MKRSDSILSACKFLAYADSICCLRLITAHLRLFFREAHLTTGLAYAWTA